MVDITKAFQASIKRCYLEQKVSKSDSSSSLPNKNKVKNPVTEQGLKISASIKKFQDVVDESKKLHLAAYRKIQSTEFEKDQLKLENEAQSLATMCNAAIAALDKETEVNLPGDNEQAKQHFRTIIIILEEYLVRAMKSFEQLKEQRMSTMKAKDFFQPKKTSSHQSFGYLFNEEKEVESEKIMDLSEPEKLLLEQENKQLYDELNDMADSVTNIVKSLHEISQMQNTLSRHIAEQAEELERVDQTATEVTENVLKGNEQIAQAIESGLDYRVWILLYLVTVSFSLLFLDWYE